MALIRPTGTGLTRPAGTGLARPANVGLARTLGTPTGATGYQAVVLADSPVGYWKLDETAGTSAADATANANAGTYVNGPTLNQTPLITSGKAALFTGGSSQYVSTPALAAYALTNALTVECWAKTTVSGTTPFFVACMKASPNNKYAIQLSTTGKVSFVVWDNADNPTTYTGAVTVNDGVTHHIVATYNGATMLLYVDGAVDGAGQALAITVAGGSDGPFIACRNSGSIPQGFMSGTIDEVAIYTTALSAARVAAHNTAGR